MTIERKNPLYASSIEKGNNTIRHIEDASFCPECNKKMEPVLTNGIPTYACFVHRINFPMKDE